MDDLVFDPYVVAAWKSAPNSSLNATMTIPAFKLLCEYALKGYAAEKAAQCAAPEEPATSWRAIGWVDTINGLPMAIWEPGREPKRGELLYRPLFVQTSGLLAMIELRWLERQEEVYYAPDVPCDPREFCYTPYLQYRVLVYHVDGISCEPTWSEWKDVPTERDKQSAAEERKPG